MGKVTEHGPQVAAQATRCLPACLALGLLRPTAGGSGAVLVALASTKNRRPQVATIDVVKTIASPREQSHRMRGPEGLSAA